MKSSEGAAVLAKRLRFQAHECGRLGSPLYEGLLERAAADVEAGGPTLAVLRGHEGDPGPSALALRLMGAVHRLVLEGRLPELATHYERAARIAPDDLAGGGGDAVDAAWPAFSAALADHAEVIRALLERTVQTNETGRGAALLPGFLAVAGEAGLPLRLLEVGASAGLNLRWDRYRYRAEDFAWGPRDSPLSIEFELRGAVPSGPIPAIAERRGCDPSPLDPASADGRLTLLSYLWPGRPARVERVLAAAAIAASTPATLERAGAAEWIAARLAAPAPGLATVVFHSIVMQYLEEQERRRFVTTVAAAGDRATAEAPLAWLRMEPEGDLAGVRLTTWPGGEEQLIARAGYHGSPVEVLIG
jgi:hypothetical protein